MVNYVCQNDKTGKPHPGWMFDFLKGGRMRFTQEDISLLVGMVSAMLAIYGRFKTEILMQEKRMTVLEKDNEFFIEFKRKRT